MIYSHPKQPLSGHIREVLTAMNAIISRHSDTSFFGDSSFQDLAQRLCRLHDTGKASSAFQKYIASPRTYKRAPKKKHILCSLQSLHRVCSSKRSKSFLRFFQLFNLFLDIIVNFQLVLN